VPEKIFFEVAVHQALHDDAPLYLHAQLTRVADIPSRQRLRFGPLPPM